MCGRYASSRSQVELLETFDVAPERADPELPADYNMAPTKISAALVARPPRDDREAPPVRQLRNLRWGFLPDQLDPQRLGESVPHEARTLRHRSRADAMGPEPRSFVMRMRRTQWWNPLQAIVGTAAAERLCVEVA